MTKKQIAFAFAGVLAAGAALLYKCQDDSPVTLPGKDTGKASAPGKVDAGAAGSRN